MRTILILLATLLFFVASDANAQQMKKFGNFEVHYNAFPAHILSASMAKMYGFSRSKNRGSLNVSVIWDDGRGTRSPVEANLIVSVRNLAGQRSNIPMRVIREKDAQYYFGQFPISGTDTYTFDIKVDTAKGKHHFELSFNQDFVAD